MENICLFTLQFLNFGEPPVPDYDAMDTAVCCMKHTVLSLCCACTHCEFKCANIYCVQRLLETLSGQEEGDIISVAGEGSPGNALVPFAGPHSLQQLLPQVDKGAYILVWSSCYLTSLHFYSSLFLLQMHILFLSQKMILLLLHLQENCSNFLKTLCQRVSRWITPCTCITCT